jgi:hypothetical protein
MRYERKFMVTAMSDGAIEKRIRLHPSYFREVYAQRFINNIYFDTQTLKYYHENERGVSNREKVRIRWYGNLEGEISNPMLEVKRKSGLTGTKLSFPLTGFRMNRSTSRADLQKVFASSDLPDEIIEKLKVLTPTLVNRYARKYYLDFTGKFRLTLDSKMSFYGIKGQVLFPVRLHQEEGAVLEFKYDVLDADEALSIPDYFPFRLTKNSKYVKGIAMHFPFVEV